MSSLWVPPKFSTPRDPTRATRGARQDAFSTTWLGKPLLPYQRHIVDVAGELNEHGLPAYRLVVVTMQRQAGKSHLAMARAGERCLSRRNFRAFYTAQTGGDAQDQFLKFNDEIVAGTPLDRLVVTRRGNGKADMTFPNGAVIRPVPPTEEAGHGKQSDLYDIDEAWAFSEDEGKAIMQAVAPTQLTRPDAQIWIWSAGGTAASTWLSALVARGRAGDPGMAYFEWGVPDDLDIEDIDAVAAHHPANGHLITVDSLRALRAQIDDPAEFARAAGNRWTEAIGGAITAAAWDRNRWTDPIPSAAPLGWGAARAADGQHVAIVAAAQVEDQVVVEVVDVIPVDGAAAQVRARAGRDPVVVDPAGPSAGLHDDLTRDRVQLLPFTGRDASAACANVLDALDSGAYRFRTHPALDAAVKVAGIRRVGDGGQAWARVAAGAPIATLEAASNAIWALTHAPRRLGKPVVHFGKAS